MMFESFVGEADVVVDFDFYGGQKEIVDPADKAQKFEPDSVELISVCVDGHDILDDLSGKCIKRLEREAFNYATDDERHEKNSYHER